LDSVQLLQHPQGLYQYENAFLDLQVVLQNVFDIRTKLAANFGSGVICDPTFLSFRSQLAFDLQQRYLKMSQQSS
jgi:hypothetical protein